MDHEYAVDGNPVSQSSTLQNIHIANWRAELPRRHDRAMEHAHAVDGNPVSRSSTLHLRIGAN
jgi:hypothetical protein